MDAIWSIEVELDERGLTKYDAEIVMDALEGSRPVVSQTPNGNLSIRIMIGASSAHEAFERGTAKVEKMAMVHGFSTAILAVELVTEKELNRRSAITE